MSGRTRYPDHRILGIPVMTMVRLSTRLPKSKTNLYSGWSGTDIKILCWKNLLKIVTHAHELTSFAYQGIYSVINKGLGPLIRELSDRPAINI